MPRIFNNFNDHFIIMDLASYLKNSKEKRQEMTRTAGKYVSRSIDRQSLNEIDDTNSYYGPNPKRFQEFKSQVEQQLQRIFQPSLEDERPAKTPFRKGKRRKNNLQVVYSGNSQILHKKQMVLIPKDYLHNFNVQAKYTGRTSSDGEWKRSSAITGLSESLEPKPKLRPNTKKETQYFPVLSTIGSHEFRSKLYKYK